MMNYTQAAPIDLTRSKSAVFDVLSDIQNDSRGLAFTLMAIAEQSSVIEPEQITILSDIAHLINNALCAVLDYMRANDGEGVL